MERRPYVPLDAEKQTLLGGIALRKETRGIIDYMPTELGFSENSDLVAIRHNIEERIAKGSDTVVLKAMLDIYDEAAIRQAEYLIETKPEQPFALVGFMAQRIALYMQISPYHYKQALNEALEWTTFYGLVRYRTVIEKALEDLTRRQREDSLHRS